MHSRHNNDGNPSQTLNTESIERVALAASYSLSDDMVDNMMSVCNGTPNPRRAIEILLGLYKEPKVSKTIPDSKERINCKFMFFDKWEDMVQYSYNRVERNQVWLHVDFIKQMEKDGASIDDPEFYDAYKAGKVIDGYWIHDNKDKLVKYLNDMPKEKGIEKQVYTLEDMTKDFIDENFKQVSILKGVNKNRSNDSEHLNVWLEKQPKPIRKGEEDIFV